MTKTTDMKNLLNLILALCLLISCNSYHDTEIKESLTAELHKNEKLKDFRIEVKKDVVSIYGETFDNEAKNEATNLARNFKNVKSVNDFITLKSLCDKWVGTFYGKNDSDPFSGTRAIKIEINKSGSDYSLSVRRKEGLLTEVTPIMYRASCNGEFLYCQAQNDGDKTPGFEIMIDDYSLSFNRVTYMRESSSSYFR